MRVKLLPIPLALIAAGCLHGSLPAWEATSAEAALDSLPRRVGRSCGDYVSGVDDGEYPGFRLVTGIAFDSTGSFLETAVLARVPASLRKPPPDPRRRPLPFRPAEMQCGTGGGGVIGPLMVNHWRGADSVWIDAVGIAKGNDNIVFIEVDTAGKWRVAGRAHVHARLTQPAPVPPPGERQAFLQQIDDLKWSAIRRSPTVRRFMQ